jgi:hypothetical protein
MKMKFTGFISGVLALLWITSGAAMAGAPLTNVEGVGGCALNPFAYVTNPLKEGDKGLLGNGIISRPQIGIWNIGLTESHINWWSAGINETFLNRVEVGYGHEFIDVKKLQNIDKDNLSMKINMIKEGDFGIGLMPAISAGLIWKNTGFDAKLRNSSDADYYLVATKMFGELPVPVILNAGLLFTKGYVRGVLGFGDNRDTVFFGNVETIVLKKIIVGLEYEQDADVGKVFRNDPTNYSTHSLWEGHIAYNYDDHLMLVASYANTGDKNSVSETAFSGGYVLSLQYAF